MRAGRQIDRALPTGCWLRSPLGSDQTLGVLLLRGMATADHSQDSVQRFGLRQHRLVRALLADMNWAMRPATRSLEGRDECRP